MSEALSTLDRVTDELVTISAVVTLGLLGLNGITEPTLVASIAGLGGYRLHKRRSQG